MELVRRAYQQVTGVLPVINWPSAQTRGPVQHRVEYRSLEPPIFVPGMEQRDYRYRTSSLWLDPERHGSQELLTQHLMKEFNVLYREGYKSTVFWSNESMPISQSTTLNELTPGAHTSDLIRSAWVQFMLVYIPQD